ncbi:hypothetical protein BV898_08442 [Hypsibius exemplaris]|uniref:Sperm flagellar protein 2 n=1 Tax=Hypsibius exemplaris TaxID=2072580 RepID=A0A1W0WQQ5_HYPEX|nr:hypothetical protein BV898_08442 [Hypsibius exemplaris]
MVPLIGKQQLQLRECAGEQRKSLLDRILHKKTHSLHVKWVSSRKVIVCDMSVKEQNSQRIRTACHFDSPVIRKTNSVLQSTRDLCQLLRQQAAANATPDSSAKASQFQAYDADANYGAKRKRQIEESLQHHFHTEGETYKAIANKTKKLFRGSGGDVCTAMVRPLTGGCSIIAGYMLNVTPLPRKALIDLRNFLKFSSSTATDGNGRAVTDGNGRAVTDGNGRAVTDGNGGAVTDGNGRATDGNGRAVTDGNERGTDGNGRTTDGNGRAVTDGEEEETAVWERMNKSMDGLDYDMFLAWEGSWRRARPSGQCYPKRSTFLSTVVCFLLNLQWQPLVPVQANFLSPIPIKVCVVGAPFSGKTTLAKRTAEFYGLCYVGILQLYADYLNAFSLIKLGRLSNDILASLQKYEELLCAAVRDGVELPDDENMELMLGYLKWKEGTVKGFVFDGFPSTLTQVREFRNRLDGFDTDRILETHKREKSKLVEDPLDPGETPLPHCLMDLVVFVSVDEQTCLQRLREREFRQFCHDETFVQEVHAAPFNQMKFVIAERRLLRLKRDCQDGLMALYRRTTKTFLELDGTRDRDRLFSIIETALSPEIQRRYNELTAEPTMNVLKGLHQAQDINHEIPVLLNSQTVAPCIGLTSPKPAYETIFQHASDGPLTVELSKIQLEKDVFNGEVNRLIEERRAHLKMNKEKGRQSPDFYFEDQSSIGLTGLGQLEWLTVKDRPSALLDDPNQTIRKAFRKFVLGEDPAELAAAVAAASPHLIEEAAKKEHHKEVNKKDAHKKGKEEAKAKPGVALAAEPVKPVKGGSPIAGTRKEKAKEVIVQEDHDEMGLLKPVRLPRKADLTNNLVKEYAQLMLLDDADLMGNPSSTPYSLDNPWLDSGVDYGIGDELRHIPEEQTQTTSRKGNELTAELMKDHFKKEKDSLLKYLANREGLYAKVVEKAYIETAVGANYNHGYPVVRLRNANILESQLAAEEKLFRLLDQRFPTEQEPTILLLDRTVDLGDSNYRITVAEPKKIVPALTTPDQLLPIIPGQPDPPPPAPRVHSPSAGDAIGTAAVGLPLPSTVKFDGPDLPVPASRKHSEKALHKMGMTPSRTGVTLTDYSFDEVCEWLADRWRGMEQYHATFTRQIFHSVRHLQETIIQQVDSCRKSYFHLAISHALHFSEPLYKWQLRFNAIEQVKRTRVQFKELLHAETVDFHKTLTENINVCRQKDTALHDEIMRSGWLEDLLSVMFNSFVGLIQLELDIYVDSLNLLRDFVSTTEYHLIGCQLSNFISIPYIELTAVVDHTAKKWVIPSITPPGSEAKKLRPLEVEKEKASTVPAPVVLRSLTLDPVVPDFISRKNFAAEAVAQLDQASNGVKRTGTTTNKSDRRSQINVELTTVTRKHSKIQAGGAATSREDIEELMLKDVMEKAKEAVLRIQETQQEARKVKYNTSFPVDPSLAKKPAPSKPALPPGKTNANQMLSEAIPPAVLSSHERAINDETTHLFLRLETICNYAVMLINDIRKVAKSLDTKIVQSIDENYRSEIGSAAMLIEYIHAQIENEEPIKQAIVYYENRFTLSVGQFVRTNPPPPDGSLLLLGVDKPSLYEELRRCCADGDEMVYEELQRAIVAAVEKSYGSDLVDRGWQMLDSDELAAAAAAMFKPRSDHFPDGVNVSHVQMDWKSVLNVLGNPPPPELKK